jgi:hypothetical protein
VIPPVSNAVIDTSSIGPVIREISDIRGQGPAAIEGETTDNTNDTDRRGYCNPKFSTAIWAMLRPMLIEAVAAGEGALRT